jgi:saccharopine dehydrogenase (NAD+, L-glutamate forming)
MRKVLIVGAGKSSPFLIKYLIENSVTENLFILIADANLQNLKKINKNKRCKTILFDINNVNQKNKLIQEADIVISLLPAHLHISIAKTCLELNTNLLTASYISEEMKILDNEVKKKGLIFLNEMGLDPGIDHMSAKKIIDRIQADKKEIISFKSFTGGLIAPMSDNNLWNYKFTWNPRNVVKAGQGSPAKFIEKGKYKYVPYYRLFDNTETINIDEMGEFEVYPNRDSLKYRKLYNLEDIQTMKRGTIRKVGFSKSWNMLIKLGLTDDSYRISNSKNMSIREFTNCFLPYDPNKSVEKKIQKELKIKCFNEEMEKLKAINLFDDKKKISVENGTPAEILEEILKDAWKLEKNDRDMIIMYHEFKHKHANKIKKTISTMVCIGDNKEFTAMSKTVGLPLAIASILILNKKINIIGITRPVHQQIYDPVLEKLNQFGINFKEYN